MEDCNLDEVMDFLKRDDFQDISGNQGDLLKVPDNSSLVDHFMSDPQFWNTFLKEDEVIKNTTKYNSLSYDSMLWSNETCLPLHNYASSSSSGPGSDHSGSSPPHPDDISRRSPEKINDSSLYVTNSNNSASLDENSLQILNRSDDSSSPTLSNYESSVNTIDLGHLGADVIVVTSSEVFEEDTNIDSDDNEVDYCVDVEGGELQPLLLSGEEKRLMEKEGVVLPKYLPLTKAEERELKRIRRKIRNKASAQNSRKRKKEYVDGLERRVKRCTLENSTLKQTIRQMQERNKSLVTELGRLQKLLANSSNKPVQSSTCLMVLLCSFALLLLPNLIPSAMESKDLFDGEKNEQKFPSVRGPSRSLSWTERAIEAPGKVHQEGFLKEENVSHLYEAPEPGSSPKHSEWSFAAGQRIENPYFPMSDETSFSEDFTITGKFVNDLSPMHTASEIPPSPPPCAQEVIITTSPD